MTSNRNRFSLWLAAGALMAGCAPSSGGANLDGPAPGRNPVPDENAARRYTYKIVATYPHDTKAYTQGLLWHGDHLIETTGRPGESTLRKVDLELGKVVQSAKLPGMEFGEGVAQWKGVYLQLTWQDGQAIAWDAKTFAELYRYDYKGEGWGLTVADDVLVMSNGTSRLQLRDPRTFELLEPRGHVDVTVWNVREKRWVPVPDLNELEWIDGELWANIYQSELIARIDLETGHVTSYIDFAGLQAKQQVKDSRQDVMNGIAYDAENDRLFVTGKYWPNLYEIEVVEP